MQKSCLFATGDCVQSSSPENQSKIAENAFTVLRFALITAGRFCKIPCATGHELVLKSHRILGLAQPDHRSLDPAHETYSVLDLTLPRFYGSNGNARRPSVAVTVAVTVTVQIRGRPFNKFIVLTGTPQASWGSTSYVNGAGEHS
jgi:hypothetical protein